MPRGSRPPWLTDRSPLSQTYLLRRREEEGDLERGETVVATEIELSNEAQSVSGTEKNIFRLAVSPARKFTEPRREGRGGGNKEVLLRSEVVFGGQKGPRGLGEGMGTAVSVEVVRQERRKELKEGGESRTARCGPTVSERMMRGGTREGEGGRDLGREGRPDSIHSMKLPSWSDPSQQGSACMPNGFKHRLDCLKDHECFHPV